jgi:RNA polymerase sigma-70 factor, ECF subfamily
LCLSGRDESPARTGLEVGLKRIFAIRQVQQNEYQVAGSHHDSSEPDDQEIIHRVVSGEVDAFEVLLRRYRSLVFGIVVRHVPHGSVEDVAQDVFVRVYQSLAGFSARSPFRNWLATIAVRSCCDFWRNRERSREVPLSTLTEDHQTWLDGVLACRSREAFLEQTDREEGKEVLHHALERISAEDRMVLSLVHLQGLPVKEAAELMGWSVVKTKVRAHRARREMRKIIAELMEVRVPPL